MAPGNQQQQQRPQQSEKDAYLEKMGLLNYQTKGMNAQQIAQKYAQAGVRTQGTWFKQNYGQDMPDPVAQPQVQINYSQPNTGGNATQGQQAQPQQRPPMSPDERSEIRYTPAPNGLVVKQKYSTVWLNGDPNAAAAQAADPNQPLFANVEQVKAGQANWEDVAAEERKALLADPNFYKKNEITKYEPGIQQQILADPNFQWDNLPKWQKTFFEISSNPKIMASPMALAGANAGSMFGTPGKIVGAAAGYAFGLVGGQEYDPTKGVAEQQTLAAKAMRVLNVLSEYAEQGAGYVGQVADAAIAGAQGNEQAAQAAKNMLFDPITREAAFEAGRLTYEYGDLGGRAISNFMQMLSGEKEFAQSGEDFVLGAAGPVDKEKVKGTNPLTGEQQFYTDVMQVLLDTRKEIEAEIRAGGNPDEIVMRRLNEAAVFVGSQTQDLALQSIADPLEYLPKMAVNAGGKIAEITGNKVAAEAFNSSNAPIQAAQKYKTLVQTGQALTIDPNFKVDQMGMFSRYVAGLNEQGQVKAGGLLPTKTGLLDPVNVDKTGWVQSMIEQTPQSRAQTGANMFYENVSALLTTFDDPHEAGRYLKALANNDMETWAQLGSRFAESPEFYTVLPALKEFNTGKLDAIVAQWDLSLNNRDALTRISGILGEEPAKWLEDTAKRGTYDQDFQRLRDRVSGMNTPEARAILKDIEAGIITPEFLKQTVDLFTGEGALPWHPGQWKAMAMDAMGTHFDEWVTKRLMLDKSPEAVSAFYRTTALMKQAQSILLLGGSPGYAITNGLSNMVNRAVTGIYGYMTPNQINSFMDRLGLTPARFEEGVGIGGQVEQAAGKSNVKTDAITKAVKGKGPLTTAKENLAKLSRGMPMSKLSGWFEKIEGQQGFAIAMKQFWSNSWRRGVGFSKMSPDMVNTIKGMGIAPERIYAAIEAGMNQTEIEKALFGRFEGVQARSLINDAAQKTGLSAAAAADMLEKVGVLDTLDTYLRGQTSKEGIQAAFTKANLIAQDYIDMQTGEDLKAIAESVKQRVGVEGAAAALDVVQKAQATYTDAWLDHYFRFGEVMNDLKLLDDPAQRSRAIDFNYEVSDGEFRRVTARNAANYKGIFDAWGMSNNPAAMNVLAAIGESDVAMANAYRTMREIRRGFFDKYRNDWENVDWDEWDANNRKIDNIFKQAFAQKKKAEIKQAAALGNIYESLYGPAAGEAARKWWEDVVAFNDEMVTREQEFRASLADMDKDQRAAAKQQYYSETKRDMIVEMDRINAEGIARLERVIKRGNSGGGQTVDNGPRTPQTPPEAGTVPNEMQPADNTDAARVQQVAKAEAEKKTAQQNRVDEFNALMAAAEQRKAADTKEIAARVDGVWEVASEYWAKGGYYERGILGAGRDKFALLNALRKPEYGGIPDLTGIEDPRLTPEIVRQILENRKAFKEAAGNQAASQAVSEQPTAKKWDVSQINEDTSLLRAIALHGGIDSKIAKDLTGESRPKSAPGVFTRKGVNIDEMARMLADDGYPINVNHPDDPGGVRQASELISRARAGIAVYPVGHDFNADIAKAEAAYYDTFENVDALYPPADPALWQTEFETAVSQGDLTKIWGMIGDYPETFDPAALDGYIRMADETAARVEAEARDLEVAQHMARAEEAIAIAETRAEAVTTRQMLKEKFAYAFGLDETQAQAYMELSDAVIGHFAKITGEDADTLYSRYYKDVVKVEGEGQATPTSPKGAVTFDADGIKATIHAFESGDFSTVIHENGHVFRRMMKDVAERTNNPYIKADLATIEDWAGVKDGVWDRAAEEKFARGFEKYITDGKAPTPALVKAFRSFKNWMIEIYKTITGSAIDVKLSPEVREVFGRMMGADGRTVADMHGNLMRVGDYVVFADKQMDIVDIFDDGRVVLENDRGDSVITSAGRFEKIVSQKIEVDQEASRIQAEETRAALLQNESFAENLRKIKEARAARNRGQSSVDGQQLYQAADPVRAWAGEYKSNTTKDSITFMVNETLPPEFSQALTDAGFTQTDLLGQEWKASKTPEAEDLINKIGVPEQVKSVDNRGTFDPADPNILFQEANQPFGAYDAASGFHPQSEVQDQGWAQHVRPLMDAMQEGAINQLSERPMDGATRDMTPEGQKMLRQYMKKVQGEMATTKLATVRWGEKQRDFAMLNYNKRYGLDRVAETVFPYQFYMTRSMGTYAARILDKPAMFATYARLRNQQERYEKDVPERLRGKIKINAPWLPEWMGGGLYVDPSSLFFPAQLLKPFERAQQDKNYQTIETERILQEWAQDGQYSQAEIAAAAQNQSGKVWERANAEAKIRRESETSNPIDFFSSMFGPAWYLSTPLNLAGIKAPGIKGDPNAVSQLPLGNTARALDTVTDGTWAEPVGNVIGLLGKFEDWGRTKLNLPTRGEYGEYYTKRQVANMVAEGLITPEDASLAMIEKSGQIWDEAAKRVDMELAMRVPGMSGVYAALHGGPADGAKAFLPSLLGAGLLPAGELEYRGLKQEWNDAWKKADAGDKTAITEFFEEHPEYEAYLAKGKDGDELLKSFLIGQIWDGYMELGTTNQKQARVEMGDLFAQSFLDKETRSYEALDIETLTAWAQMLNKKVPQVQGQAVNSGQPSVVSGQSPQMDLYSPAVTGITDQFFEGRKELFPNYYEQQQGYYALPKSERAAYLMRNPDLKKYWDWKESWYESYPQYVPIFNGQAFKTVDTSTWPPALEDFVRNYAYTGKKMPSGAYAALQQVWIMEGQPMGDFDTWVNSQVVPAMKYQGEGE